MLLLMEGEVHMETWFGPGNDPRFPGITFQVHSLQAAALCTLKLVVRCGVLLSRTQNQQISCLSSTGCA
jgi:hypothetical protein